MAVTRIVDLSQKEMEKICKKAGECKNCPLDTYIGCFYSFKLNDYLDLLVDTKTLKRYLKDKGE